MHVLATYTYVEGGYGCDTATEIAPVCFACHDAPKCSDERAGMWGGFSAAASSKAPPPRQALALSIAVRVAIAILYTIPAGGCRKSGFEMLSPGRGVANGASQT